MITPLSKRTYYCLLVLVVVWSQSLHAQETTLDKYISEAYKNSIVLQQKNISLEKAKLALNVAKSYYYPNIGFQFGYQTAQGGRDIQLPIGDMLNGVYSTLNMLTQSNNFPQIENQSINFLPKNFYDAKVRTTAPLFNAELNYNKKLAKQQLELPEYEINIYKRDLAKDVKIAYHNYLMANKGVQIYQQALVLADEAKRVNQSLINNGRGLPAYLLRSEAEAENIKAEINRAQQQSNNAQAYLNFLLNRPLNEVIDTLYNPQIALIEANSLLQENQGVREEIKTLSHIGMINQTVLDLRKSAYYPKLNAFLDLGSQAENFKFNSQSRYYMVGLQLDFPIFSGFRNQNNIKQAKLDIWDNQLQQQQANNHISLGIQTAQNDLNAQIQILKAKEKQAEATATYLRLIERGYKEGSNSFIETIDARNQHTQALMGYQVQQFHVLNAAAELERALATTDIKE